MKRATLATVRLIAVFVSTGGFAVVVRAGAYGLGAVDGRVPLGFFVAGVVALAAGLTFFVCNGDGRE